MTWRIEAAPAASGAESGFTLIEIIVVLVVIGLILGIAVARGPMRSPSLEARAAADRLVRTLRLARTQAIAADHTVTVAVDPERHLFALDGATPQSLPPQMEVALAVADTVVTATPGHRVGVVRFAPDGSSSGGRVTLTEGRHSVAVGVDWLTGRVTIADAD